MRIAFSKFGLCIAAFAALACAAAQANPTTFTVSEKAPTLTHVSFALFKSPVMWRQIADWNGIKAPYILRAGQVLVIKEIPRSLASFKSPRPEGIRIHQVSNEGPTLGHIAVQVFGRFEYWRKIAEWNRLPPPYIIQPGQELVLEQDPDVVRKIASASAFDPNRHYIVDELAPTPSEIGMRLYGKASMWKKILEWNKIPAPSEVRLGRRLILKEPPTKSTEEGNQLLSAMWQRLHDRAKSPFRKRAALEMIAKLGNTKPAETTPVSAVKTDPESEVKAEAQDPEAPTTEVAASQPYFAEEEEEPEAVTSEDAPAANSSTVSAMTLFTEGEVAFKASNYALALEKFRASRTLNAEPLPCWFYEIRTLRMLKKEDEAKTVAKELLERQPNLKTLPMFQAMFPAPDSDRELASEE